MIHAAFSAFDLDHSGTIDFGEFAYTLAVMTQGTPSEKLEILFKCYDIGGSYYFNSFPFCFFSLKYFFFSLKYTRWGWFHFQRRPY